MAKDVPDPTYRLSTEERARLTDGINADALERLLQRLPPESRQLCLRLFTGEGIPAEPGSWFRLVGFAGLDDPEVPALLEQVYPRR